MTEQMTTRGCKARKCDDLVLVPGEFGYRCRLTGEVPRHMPGCPKDVPLSPQKIREGS